MKRFRMNLIFFSMLIIGMSLLGESVFSKESSKPVDKGVDFQTLDSRRGADFKSASLAVVDTVEAYQECDETKRHKKRLDESIAGLQKDLEKLKESVGRLQSDFRKDEITLSALEKEERVIIINRKIQDFNMLEDKIKRQYGASMEKFAEVQVPKIEKAINAVSEEMGFDIVFRKRSVEGWRLIEYVSKKFDITRNVIARINSDANKAK